MNWMRNLATILIGMWLIFPTAGSLAGEKEKPVQEDRTQLVYKEPGKHCGFPNLLRLANRDLLVHFRVGITHAGEAGVIKQVRSTDNGKTWSDARVVAEDPYYDFRTSSTGIQLPDGKILLPFYPFDAAGRKKQKNKPGWWGYWPGGMMIVSNDNGKTWSKPIKLPKPFRPFANGGYLAYTCGKIIRLADGTLLLGIHGRSPDEKPCTGVVRSVDNGETWTDFVRIAADDERNYFEPSFAVLGNGDILALNRTAGTGGGWMYKCISEDDGRTWSSPVKTEIHGAVPELIVLPSGNMLCSYRSYAGANDTRMCISRDQGKTWVNEMVIDPSGGDHGYTSSVLLDDGSVYSVNYCTKDGLTQIRSNIARESGFDRNGVRL